MRGQWWHQALELVTVEMQQLKLKQTTVRPARTARVGARGRGLKGSLPKLFKPQKGLILVEVSMGFRLPADSLV